MNSVRFTVAAAAVLLASPALAQPPAAGAAPPPSGPMFPMTRAAAQSAVQARFATRDANHDGFMTNDELGGAAAMVIGRLDADHDGRVSLAEAMARTLTDFDAADANHDGTVTEDEAAAMMSPPAQPATPSATNSTSPQGN